VLTGQIVLNDGRQASMWMTCANKSYDFAYSADHTGTGTGPHKHSIQQTFFLYVYEPGGNRVEIANAGARLTLAPDWCDRVVIDSLLSGA
jgi:catechol 2,3-dioxygenase